MHYQIKTLFQVKYEDIHKVVHPYLLSAYYQKTRLMSCLDDYDILLVEQLPFFDGVLDPSGNIRYDVDFTLRGHLNYLIKQHQLGGNKVRHVGGAYRPVVEQPKPEKEQADTKENRRRDAYQAIVSPKKELSKHEKKHGVTKKTINAMSPTIEEMLANPELDGISSVNIDPVSMAVETVVDLIDGAKAFIANPSLGGVAAMAAIAIPGKVADKFSVGAYDKIKGTVPNMDAHHVGQKALMNKFIPNYDLNKAPAILVPKVGHTLKGPNGIVSRKTTGIDTARGLIARDIKELRRVYPDIPNSQLKKLVDMNKELYPDAFVKRK